ncbi:MAG: LysM peptidoglycan-binding domain-containing protein [Gammaproteobacteria bacterium]|nr:LysM peptidoglycan-binding domain-containing protein [Gammaproteobacteria bacterium]
MRKFLTAALLLVVATIAHGDDLLFPQPAELDRDVGFWLSIFTEYTTREGVLHDSRNLAVVYEKVPLPENASRRQRQRVSDQRRQHYKRILQKLASGERTGLSTEEQRVLDLWPEDVTNKELTAAVSQIRFQLGLSDRFQEGLRRAGRYREHINREFTRLGVPIELAALPHVESSYNTDARSHVGASGIWQFTRSTGRRFLRVDHVLDERNDPFLATTAAGKLLAYNYSIAGNWPMAITAYNHGLAGARRAMRTHGDTNYADILRNYRGRTFGFASRNFYVAFLAAKEVDQNPDRYFPGLVPYQPVDYDVVQLESYIPADQLAKALNVSERDIARHNQALQATIWQGSKHLPRGISIRMPSSMLNSTMTNLVASLPPDYMFDKQLPDLFHTVARGDTLSEIADTYDTRVSTLVALNSLSSSNRIRAGQQIRLPAAGPAPATPPPTVAAAPVAAPPAAALADAPAIGPGPAVEDEPAGPLSEQVSSFIGGLQAALLSDPSDYTVAENGTIEVHPLETLGHYADWLGLRTQRLRDINGMAFRTPVEVGKRIKLDFSQINTEQFEQLRTQYHRQQQDTFFRTHTITGLTEHVVSRGESVWILSLREYDVPVWLFRQYNPELDLHNVQPGTRLNFPVLAEKDRS